MTQGILYTVSAPSGAGKTSLLKAVLEADTQLGLSISHTTRPQRPQEQDGQDYHFIAEDDFLGRAGKGEFLEHAQVHGYYYGTSQGEVDAILKTGRDLVLEIDWQGMQQIRKLRPDTVSIFVLPPSRDALESRLRNRGQDSDEVIAKRLAAARDEITHYAECDYLIINDDFAEAVQSLLALFASQRLRESRQSEQHQQLIQDLLK